MPATKVCRRFAPGSFLITAIPGLSLKGAGT
jgi:hypothetical protein